VPQLVFNLRRVVCARKLFEVIEDAVRARLARLARAQSKINACKSGNNEENGSKIVPACENRYAQGQPLVHACSDSGRGLSF